jgi:PAS domain-containing protein/DNA-binding CsgD family transcriptional regulator
MNTQKALVINQEASFLESRQGLEAFNEALAPFENIEPAIIGLTSTGSIVYVNRSACDLLGSTPEELKGLPIGALSPGLTARYGSHFWLGLDHEDSEQGQTMLHLTGKKELTVEFRPLFVHESGLKYCLLTKPEKRPAAGGTGEPYSWTLAQVLTRMGNPAVIRDEQHKIVFLNPAACRWLGTTAAEAAGTTVFDYLPKRYAEIAWKQEQDALDSGRASTHACHGFLRAKYHESVILLPFLDPGSSKKMLVVIVNEPPQTIYPLPAVVSDSHKAAPGRTKTGYLTKVLEKLGRGGPIAIFLKDSDNRFLWVNHAFAQVTGFETKDFIGKLVEDVVSDPDVMATLRKQDQYVISSGKPLFDLVIPRFDNQPGHYRLDKIPFLNRKGELAGIIGLIVTIDDSATPVVALKNELGSMSQKLQETETALRVVLEQRGQDVYLARKGLRSKVKDLIVPYLEQLKQTRLTPEQVEFVDLIETNLKDFYDPAQARLSSPTYTLSPSELKVAQFVRDGKTNKEIARLMGLSKSTVLTHRHHVRAKLGIKNKKINLRCLLNS